MIKNRLNFLKRLFKRKNKKIIKITIERNKNGGR